MCGVCSDVMCECVGSDVMCVWCQCGVLVV